MSLTSADMIAKSEDQRKRGRYQEALISAQKAIELEPKSPQAWWNVAINQVLLGLRHESIASLEKTVELWPMADGAWAQLGKALAEENNFIEAKECLHEALEINPYQSLALLEISKIYSSENVESQDLDEIEVLKKIEDKNGLQSHQASRLGYISFRKSLVYEAIKYWEISSNSLSSAVDFFNLGVAYNHSSVSRFIDAMDVWQLNSELFPHYEQSRAALSQNRKRFSGLFSEIRGASFERGDQDSRYDVYINPFHLLNIPERVSIDDIGPQDIKKYRRALLQEMELEDGRIDWLGGARLDKSKVIEVCEELNNKKLRHFHRVVFKDKYMMDFLHSGSSQFFVSDPADSGSRISLLEEVYCGGDDFRIWLGKYYGEQLPRLLSYAVKQNKVSLLKAALARRSWIDEVSFDKALEPSGRYLDTLIEDFNGLIDDCEKNKKIVKPLLDLEVCKNVIGILDALPIGVGVQNTKFVESLRRCAILSVKFNASFEDAFEFINVASGLLYVSGRDKAQLDDDYAQIESLRAEQKKNEVRLQSKSGEKWEILKSGVRCGSRFIAAEDVSGVTWGATITGDSRSPRHDFLVSFKSEKGGAIKFSWSANGGVDPSKYFNDMANAILLFIFPSVLEKIKKNIHSGKSQKIGNCVLSDRGVKYDVRGWFFTHSHFVSWRNLDVSIKNGVVHVSDRHQPKEKTEFNVIDTENSFALTILPSVMTEQV